MSTQAGDLLTVREAARRLGISQTAVRRLVKRGVLPHVRPLPGVVRIRPEAVEHHINRTTCGGDVHARPALAVMTPQRLRRAAPYRA